MLSGTNVMSDIRKFNINNKNIGIKKASGENSGLMSIEDKMKLDAMSSGGDNGSVVIDGVTEETVREMLDVELSNKVDKEYGKGLSTNDFTDEYQDKLDNIDSTIDDKLSSVSTELQRILTF